MLSFFIFFFPQPLNDSLEHMKKKKKKKNFYWHMRSSSCKTIHPPLFCSQFTKQNNIFTFIVFTIYKSIFFAETDAASGINVVNSSSKSGWPSKSVEIWNCKTKTSKNTDNYINKKTFQNKSSETNRTLSGTHCGPYLSPWAPSGTHL